MKTPVDTLIDSLQPLHTLKIQLGTLAKQKKIFVSPFAGSAKSIFVKLALPELKQLAIFCPSIQSVNETKVELSLMDIEDPLIIVDEFNIEFLQEKLTDINNRDKFILISTYDLLKLKLPSKNSVKTNTTKIEIGGNLTYDDLIEYLNSINYDRTKFVESPGDFSVRGSIIDFWSFSEKQPSRLEFDGDFLESIRHFDPETQRSLNKLTFVTVAASIDEVENDSDIFDYLDNPIVMVSEYELEKLSEVKTETNETSVQFDIDEDLKEELYETENIEVAKTSPKVKEIEDSFSSEILFEKNAMWIVEDEIGRHEDRLNLNLMDAPIINSNFELLYNLLKDYTNRSFRIMIAVENELQSKRLYDLLTDFKEEVGSLIEEGKIKFIVFPIKNGFISKDTGLMLLTDYQIFNKPYRTKALRMDSFRKIPA
jgi:transcription-repair coupling factor (superfamily II helicase)